MRIEISDLNMRLRKAQSESSSAKKRMAQEKEELKAELESEKKRVLRQAEAEKKLYQSQHAANTASQPNISTPGESDDSTASIESRVAKMKVEEQQLLASLRAIRKQLAMLRTDEEAQRQIDAQAYKDARLEKQMAAAMANKARSKSATSNFQMVRQLRPTDIRAENVEAMAMVKALDMGRVLLFTFKRADAGSNNAIGEKGVEQYIYQISDPADLQMMDMANDRSAIQSKAQGTVAKQKTLIDDYFQWRKKFSVKTSWQEWSRELAVYMEKQQDRYQAALTILDIECSTHSVIAVFRLIDDPSEYTSPVKNGDVVIIWSPTRDEGNMTMDDRSLANPAVVNQFIQWGERQNVLAQRIYRCDAASTEQGENSPLDYDFAYRKLFQKARVR